MIFVLLHKKIAFCEYVNAHSVVLKVSSVKFLKITKLKIKNHALELQLNPCYGLLEQQKNHAMVLRATSKLMLRYLKQQVNSCYRYLEQ